MKKVTTGKHVLGLLLAGTGLLLGMSAVTGGITTAAAANSITSDGSNLLETRCSACHSADRPKRAHKSPEEWEQTVSRMIGKGAQLSPAEKSAAG